VQSYALTLGLAGNRTQIVEYGSTVRAYGYDELYRLTSDTVTIAGLSQYAKAFVYDDVGNRQTQTTTIGPAGSPGVPVQGTLTYGYDERDRLTSEALGANPPTTYGWDADGNLTTKSGEATYAWDRENRLVRVTKTDGTVVENTYDFDGTRVRTVTTPSGGAASTTSFLVDTSGSLSHVVAETNGAGALVVHYVRGDDLLALMRPNGSGGWASRFYHADHIGSVRRLTDESGAITDGYTYTAFGELLGHTGSDPQPYAFTGEPYDPNVGFQYHRARWMDPSNGRFTGVDPFEGVPADPLSLHRYLYAAANPVGNSDPTGKQTLQMSNATLGVIATLAALSLLSTLGAQQGAADAVYGATSDLVGDIYDENSYAAQRAILAAELALTVAYRSVAGAIEYAKQLTSRTRRGQRLPKKIVPMPYSAIPNIAQHVRDAQTSGHHFVLTRTSSVFARLNRRNAIRGSARVLGLSLDEYPFASSVQGGFGASVRPVPALENLIQGGIIAASYYLERIQVGDDYLVVVIP
jgi:RHS repeat-associated protein